MPTRGKSFDDHIKDKDAAKTAYFIKDQNIDGCLTERQLDYIPLDNHDIISEIWKCLSILI